MSNIGRKIRNEGRIIGAVVAEISKGKRTMFRIALADGEKRNPVLGDFSLIDARFVEFADEQLIGYAEPMTDREARELARAGGDATLVRRRGR